MEIEEIVSDVAALPGVVVHRPVPGDGSPEVAWGDVFVHHAPDGVPHGQPFATVVTKAYPDEEDVGAFDRPGSFRLNVAVGRRVAAEIAQSAGDDPAERDAWRPHPVYGALGWVAVVDPGPRTAARARELLRTAHAAAAARHERRHARVGEPDAGGGVGPGG